METPVRNTMHKPHVGMEPVERIEFSRRRSLSARYTFSPLLIQVYGDLFEAVQNGPIRIFKDSKTFVDCIPVMDPALILQAFREERFKEGFHIAQFVSAHFIIPSASETADEKHRCGTVYEHVENTWELLKRKADARDPHSDWCTLIPLPLPYFVPGGRFGEIYYWDTYFTCLGLISTGRLQWCIDLAENLAHLIHTVGHIPNGNREYYRPRSQPPFFSHILELLESKLGTAPVAEKYVQSLEMEYRWWMRGEDKLTPHRPAVGRVVRVVCDEGDDGEVVTMNRYNDNSYCTPREESYREDVEIAHHAEIEPQDLHSFYRHIRAAAESGWDFSSRWFADKLTLDTICTTDILPVDLNCIMLHIEGTLERFYTVLGRDEEAQAMRKAHERRARGIQAIFWNEEHQFYFDFNWVLQKHTGVWSVAGVFPLFAPLSDTPRDRAAAVAKHVKDKFLQPGGFVVTWVEGDVVSGHQWDWPNGWAPMTWVICQGLLNHGYAELAKEGADRWQRNNEVMYEKLGDMLEKYNVVHIGALATDGEYDLQTGFGWTNGVYEALSQLDFTPRDKPPMPKIVPTPRLVIHDVVFPKIGQLRPSPTMDLDLPSVRSHGSSAFTLSPIADSPLSNDASSPAAESSSPTAEANSPVSPSTSSGDVSADASPSPVTPLSASPSPTLSVKALPVHNRLYSPRTMVPPKILPVDPISPKFAPSSDELTIPTAIVCYLDGKEEVPVCQLVRVDELENVDLLQADSAPKLADEPLSEAVSRVVITSSLEILSAAANQ